MALSNLRIQHAKATGKPYTLGDFDGLSLFVSAKGSKAWHFRYYWVGKQIRISLGTYMPQPGGHWKATNNDIVERHPDGSSRIRFRPVAAHLTPMAMNDMIARYRTALDQHLADPLVFPCSVDST